MSKIILIIEDNDTICSALVEFLESKGFSVLSSGDGFLGLQLAQKHQPDLIICDLNLPTIDGFCVLTELRKDSRTAKIIFIFLTADTNPQSRSRSRELGANNYLLKPIDLNFLLQVIISQLQGVNKSQ